MEALLQQVKTHTVCSMDIKATIDAKHVLCNQEEAPNGLSFTLV
jgi:hypothetical protein